MNSDANDDVIADLLRQMLQSLTRIEQIIKPQMSITYPTTTQPPISIPMMACVKCGMRFPSGTVHHCASTPYGKLGSAAT